MGANSTKSPKSVGSKGDLQVSAPATPVFPDYDTCSHVHFLQKYLKRLSDFFSNMGDTLMPVYHSHKPGLLHNWSLLQVCYKP